MGLLDDHNALHGAFTEDAAGPGRAAPWAWLSLVTALLWFFGFGSIVALGAGTLALRSEPSPATRLVAVAGLGLGAVGLLAGLAVALVVAA